MAKPKPKDPFVLAKAALTGVMDRAIAAKDDDRILASAKQVLSMLEKEKPAPATDADYLDVQTLTEEEFRELGELLDSITVFKKRVKARLAEGLSDNPH